MKIVLLGATGMVGRRIAAEAVDRGHQVTCVSRSGEAPVPGVTSTAADAGDTRRVAALAAGHDAVATALVPPRDGSEPREPFLALNRAVVDAVRAAGVSRLVVVGGAGSLEVAPGEELVDQPGFPTDLRGEALAHRDVLTFYRTVGDLDWTYVSPPAEIAPGERTGNFRLGGDQLLSDDEGRSHISAEDYAAAFVDELERNAHPRTRITVAY
ncbi:NAD(P)-dependent oxidoreductase [Streptomyces sp. NPDC019645]|uniref:NAD(P)-dependent oxidoreductase n=1 Tax=Streptomyces sp. NPDC019645 TaxID=3154786 RepID=UPI0033CF34B5